MQESQKLLIALVLRKKMDQKKRLIINVISNYISYFVFGISNFVLIGYLVRRLGSDAFGVVSLLISTTVFAELLGAGVGQALTKHIAAAAEKKDADFINRLVSTALLWFGICGLAGAIIFGTCSVYIEKIINVPARLVSDASLGMMLIAVRVLICFPFDAYQGVLLSHQRYDLVNGIKCVTIFLRVFLIILYCEVFSPSITAVIVITIISLLIERSLWVLFSYKIASGLKIGLFLFSRASLIILLGFGSFMFIIQVGNLLGYEAVKWVIGMDLNVVAVGAYTLVATLAVVAGELVRSISNVLVPVSSRYHALGLHANNATLGMLGTKYAMIVASFFCLMPLLLLKPFLCLWVGKQYPEEYMSQIAAVGIVLLVGQWFISTGICLVQIATGMGRNRFPALVTIIWAVCGITVCWFYLHFIHKSLFAAALIMAIARCLGTTAHVIYGMYLLRVKRFQFLSRSIFKPAIAGLAACATMLIISPVVNINHIPGFLLAGAVLTVIYSFITWFIVLSEEEHHEVIGKLGSIKTFILSKV